MLHFSETTPIFQPATCSSPATSATWRLRIMALAPTICQNKLLSHLKRLQTESSMVNRCLNTLTATDYIIGNLQSILLQVRSNIKMKWSCPKKKSASKSILTWFESWTAALMKRDSCLFTSQSAQRLTNKFRLMTLFLRVRVNKTEIWLTKAWSNTLTL